MPRPLRPVKPDTNVVCTPSTVRAAIARRPSKHGKRVFLVGLATVIGGLPGPVGHEAGARSRLPNYGPGRRTTTRKLDDLDGVWELLLDISVVGDDQNLPEPGTQAL